MQRLPKIELHCHLDGLLDPALLWEISDHDLLSRIDHSEFQKMTPVDSLSSFMKFRKFLQPIEGDLAFYRKIIEKHIERLKAQRVLYAEIMIATNDIPVDENKAADKLATFREWVNRKASGDIQIEFLAAISRGKPYDYINNISRIILKLFDSGLIVGVALAGPEWRVRVRSLQTIFARFHDAGLGIEIHAGEWCGPESVWDALHFGCADRIGHGVSIFEDPELLDFIRERRVHIEMCPSSNLKTGSISHIEQHPVCKARELDLNYSINTDDPGPFASSMESEYELLSTMFGFNILDFNKIYVNSLQARFCREDKSELYRGEMAS